VMTARTLIGEPQQGQASTSTSYTFLINRAQADLLAEEERSVCG
jgi:hypothetical protein